MSPQPPETIVVELRPYRERRRTRSFAAGLLLGLAFSAFIVPIIVEVLEDLLGTDEPPATGIDLEAVARYGGGGE